VQYSSGDIVADRRASYAAALAAEHAFGDAAELMAQALERVPHWVAGWTLLGGYREEAGDIAGAVAAWGEVLRLDVEGVFGARLKLAAHGALDDTRAATAYVEALFDDYAPRFEDSLVQRLGYRIPQDLAAAIKRTSAGRGTPRFSRVLDVGCGTGLMGQELRGMADRLDGVDLSERMLAEARRKSTYDRLEKAELVEFLGRARGIADLVVAADVFNYVGALGPALSAVRTALLPRGMLAFSLETHDGSEPVRLGAAMRFQHAVQPTLAELGARGFAVAVAEPCVVRMDRGLPVDGMIVVAVLEATDVPR